MPVTVVSVLWTSTLVPKAKYFSFETQHMVLLCFHDLDEDNGKKIYIANLYF